MIRRLPRWLVFNKIDLMDKTEAEEKAKAIAEALGWKGNTFDFRCQSARGERSRRDVMTFIIENPIAQLEEAKQPEKSSSCGTIIIASSWLKWKKTQTMTDDDR